MLREGDIAIIYNQGNPENNGILVQVMERADPGQVVVGASRDSALYVAVPYDTCWVVKSLGSSLNWRVHNRKGDVFNLKFYVRALPEKWLIRIGNPTDTELDETIKRVGFPKPTKGK